MRMYKLSLLMGDTWIRKLGEVVRANGDFEYGNLGDIFWGSDGNLYINLDTDGDGKSDAVTDLRFVLGNSVYDEATGASGGAGGITGGNSDNGIGNSATGIGGFGGSGNGTGAGTVAGGSTGGGSGEGAGRDTGTGNDIGIGESGVLPSITIKPPRVDPIWGIPDKDLIIPEKPKTDLSNDKADPLVNMEILGTLKNGVKGGRFGMGRGRMHRGCDLKAEVGTPIFAMFDGDVIYCVTKFSNDIPWKSYAKTYGSSAEDMAAGNRLWIRSTLSDGSKIIIKMFHLNTIFALSGSISSGDIIGTVGTTGSACSERNAGPHLHIEVWKDGISIDPETYFNTQLDENGKPINE